MRKMSSVKQTLIPGGCKGSALGDLGGLMPNQGRSPSEIPDCDYASSWVHEEYQMLPARSEYHKQQHLIMGQGLSANPFWNRHRSYLYIQNRGNNLSKTDGQHIAARHKPGSQLLLVVYLRGSPDTDKFRKEEKVKQRRTEKGKEGVEQVQAPLCCAPGLYKGRRNSQGDNLHLKKKSRGIWKQLFYFFLTKK